MHKLFKLHRWDKDTKIVELFGLFLIRGCCGNCFSPAVHFEKLRDRRERTPKEIDKNTDPAWAMVTVRCPLKGMSKWTETNLYLRLSGRIDWNSEHLAKRFGEHCEPSDGSPDYHIYHGPFGSHLNV